MPLYDNTYSLDGKRTTKRAAWIEQKKNTPPKKNPAEREKSPYTPIQCTYNIQYSRSADVSVASALQRHDKISKVKSRPRSAKVHSIPIHIK